MRISNPFLISLFVIVLIALNLYIIPQQRKVQFELDKKAVWKVLSSVDIVLDYTLLGSNSLIESVGNEVEFRLRSFDLETGKLLHTKIFSDEIGLASQVVCIENALYVIFATSRIYKLDATTLEVLWKTDWSLSVYNWTEINVEQSKNLILIAASNTYLNFYTFLNEATGDIYYQQEIAKDYIVENSIVDIFAARKGVKWGAYYNFKNNKFVLDTSSKSILFIEDDYLTDISDSLNLRSLKYSSINYKNYYKRYDTNDDFHLKRQAIDLSTGITNSHIKEITNIQATPKCIVFSFEIREDERTYRYVPVVDYAFLGEEETSPSLNIHNVEVQTETCLSEDYFVALRNNANKAQVHQELMLIDLNKLYIKPSFYVPWDQQVLKLLCDQKQLYVLVQKTDGKTYWIALPLN